MKRLSTLLVLLWCAQLGAVSAAPRVLRAHVVPIVNQERFLERVLEPFASARGIRLEVTPVHGREVARAAREGRADLVIMHTRFPGRQRLLDDGVISGGDEVFANPIALLAPAQDPAGVGDASSAAEAMARIRAQGACVLENDLDGLVTLTRELAGDLACYRRERQAVGLGAVLRASQQGWYTWWGLHPFAMSGQAMRPVVWPEPALLRPLSAATVSAAPGARLAADAIAWLRGAEAREAIAAFRLAAFPAQQAFWPMP
jgi:hypothetical protein